MLWELCGVEGRVDVDKHCYEVMDRLLERQVAIQQALARKHLQNGHLVLYDITSNYLEGEYEGSQLVDFGVAIAVDLPRNCLNLKVILIFL